MANERAQWRGWWIFACAAFLPFGHAVVAQRARAAPPAAQPAPPAADGKDKAANKNASAKKPAAAKPAKPAKRRTSTYHEFQGDLLAYNRRTLGEASQKVGKRDPKRDAAAGQFLDLMARYFTDGNNISGPYRPVGKDRVTHEQLLTAGKPVIKGHDLPPDFAAGLKVGLAGIQGEGIQFTNLRIGNLRPGAAGPGPGQAAAVAAGGEEPEQ